MDEMAAAIQAEKQTPTANADGNPNRRRVNANSFEPVVQALHNHQPTVVMAPLINAPRDEVIVTDNDILFGRGGLTNRHTGNLRYRDLVSLHRPDYVNASKMEKPNVSRRIVMAIKSGPNAGRFLKKDDIGWLEVSDREATWKCSQALREKTRWSSMKKDEAEEASSITAMSSPVQIIAGMAQDSVTAARVVPMVDQVTSFPTVAEAAKKEDSSTAAETRGAATKRKADAPTPEHGKKLKPDESPLQPQQKMSTIEMSLLHGTRQARNTHVYNLDVLSSDQISIPPLEGLDTSGLVPLPRGQSDIQPRDEDVLFGRGGKTNHHPGNKRLRVIVEHYRKTYCHAKKVDKPKVSKIIVAALRVASPPSRFLRLNEDTKSWIDVGDRRAAEKVSQTLREKDKDQKREIKAAKSQAIAGIAHASAASQHGNVPCNLPQSHSVMSVVESSRDEKTKIIARNDPGGGEHSATAMATGLPGATPDETCQL